MVGWIGAPALLFDDFGEEGDGIGDLLVAADVKHGERLIEQECVATAAEGADVGHVEHFGELPSDEFFDAPIAAALAEIGFAVGAPEPAVPLPALQATLLERMSDGIRALEAAIPPRLC